ncbi:MAG: indolepyruvate oxidoreductase subunit beta [Desulfurococcaceae archaeon]
MKRYNIAVVGVGGQGLLTLGAVLGTACSIAKYDVAIAEVHGMSQRGGSVIVYVKIGSEPSPIIPIGGADHVIALELLEAARYAAYAKKGAVVSINNFTWPPPLSTYPSREEIITALRGNNLKLYLIDANELSMKYLGSPISANIAMLGFALGVDPVLRSIIGVDVVEKALSEHFRGKALEANKQVLRTAFQEGLKVAEK